MKKHIILFFFCLMAISVSVQAQRHHHGGKHHMEKMKSDLDLSDEQVKQMEEMSESLRGEMMKIKKSDLSMEEKHAKMKELGDKKKEWMGNILTAEQRTKMEKMHNEKKEMHKKRKAKMKEKHMEMKQFMTEKVKPLMTEKRAELDQQMKKKDRKKIDELRAIAKEVKNDIRAKHEEMKKKFENEDKSSHMKGKKEKHGMHHRHRGPKGQHKMEMMKFMKEYEAEFKQAETYASKYAAEIDQLMEAAGEQMKEWKMEMKEERKNFKKEKQGKAGKDCCKEQAEGCCTNGAKNHDKSARKSEMTDEKMEERRNLKRIGFLLMPSKMDDEPKTREMIGNALESKVYPNPSANSNTLEINVPNKAQYTIELYNEVGRRLKVISNSKLGKGNHSFQVDLSDLPSGLYYYVITNGKEKTSQKFMKN